MRWGSRKIVIRIIEFFIIGLVFGVVEDLLAIWIATDAHIDGRVVMIAALVALPFAFFSELVVDRPGFWKKIFPFLREEVKEIERKVVAEVKHFGGDAKKP